MKQLKKLLVGIVAIALILVSMTAVAFAASDSQPQEQEQEISFTDVQNPDAWFYQVVYDIVKIKNANGKPLMSGFADGSGRFGATDPLTRQDFAVILYRLADEPAVPDMDNPFDDTSEGGYYYGSVLWAKATGVISGYDNGKFGVGDKITREQVATILYRFANEFLKMDTSKALAEGDLSTFDDKAAVSSWAQEALTWANGAGIIKGTADNKINARGNAARAEIAAMMIRFLEYHRAQVEEASITLVVGEKEITVTESEIKAATKVEVTEEDPWTYKNGQNKGYGTFYSVKSILENANVDYSEAHGLKMVASDGFVTGFTKEEIETLYIFDMAEVNRNGEYGEAGTFGTAINGSAGNKWATKVVKAEVATDHVWFFKGGACKHYCAICGADEPSITLIMGEQTVTVHECEIKAATSVTDTFTFNETVEATGTFYSMKDILEKANISLSDAHGLKAVASDGFVTGYTVEDVDKLYIFDMGEVVSNGQPMGEAGKFRTAINGSAGNKWATDVVKFEVATDHVWFIKKGACKHYCAICNADEPDANYAAVDAAIAKANALDATLYTDESYAAVTAAVAAVEKEKKTCEQAAVDAMAKNIEDAIAALVEKQ
ncbi:MAG: S-layer homology domain-containing protein [Lachnospiraceae bacterium]|nr:S-layer homology domain-containing protein [Lachnospiraceae bacterium]